MMRLFKYSKHWGFRIWLMFILGWTLNTGMLGQQRYPVTVNVNVIPPYSVFLSDYTSIGSNKLIVTLVFNDYNEISRDVYLKLRIESSNLRMKSRADFIPSKPITLFPGVPVQISGDDLATYFDLNNIDLSGISKADMSTSGRLLEGNYVFCFEIYDYKKHTLISNESCGMGNVRLNDPPVLVLPQDISVVPLNSPNINFQWQLPLGDPTNLKYILSLYELPDYNVSPSVAVQNNQAIKIFESQLLDNPYFIYDINSPLLKKGLKYAWRVQAQNTNKRNDFKNNGFSLVRGFSYGYPENGKIIINTPIQGHAFSLRESKTFRWLAPDNLTPNQPYFYQTTIVKVKADQSDSDAIAKNAPVYSNQSAVLNPQNIDYELTATSSLFASQQKFAWQVTAHTNNQKIASSSINDCFGPPLIEAFYAGNHTVFVTCTTSSNINDLTGDGEVKISYDGTVQRVHFEHIKIEAIGALLIMKQGCVKAKYTGLNINLKAEYTGNGKATYEVDSVMIDTQYMWLKGIVNWVFPHLTITPQNPCVKTVPKWIAFEDFVLTGVAKLEKSQVFELADPYGFTLSFDSTSCVIIRGNNNYCPNLNGNVTLPKNVKNSSAEKVTLPFTDADRLDFIKQQGVPRKSAIELISGSGIGLYATSYSIDLSDTKSEGKLYNQPEWKGIYITGSSVEFPNSPDRSSQLFFKNTLDYSVHDSLGASDTCWVTSQGLQLRVNKLAEHPDTLWFNTFPGVFGNYRLVIQNSILTKGFIKGNITIPLLSEKNRFPFTVPITEQGFTIGFLDQSLDGSTILFNPEGGEQKVNLTINRAVFANRERLDMNIDLAWPVMDIQMKALENFEIWGNASIGFRVPNGTTPLSSELQSKIKGFEVTIDYIGCGRQANMYAFGTSGKIVMGEDIAGPDGAPVVNIFSIAENTLLSGNLNASSFPDRFQNLIIQGGGKGMLGSIDSIGTKSIIIASKDTIDKKLLAAEISQKIKISIDDLGQGGVMEIDSTSLLPKTTSVTKDSVIQDSKITLADILKLIDKVIPFLNEEQIAKAEEFKRKIASYDQSELVLIYNEIKNYDKILKDIAKAALKNMVTKMEKPIKVEAAKIKSASIGFINTKRDSLLSLIDYKINNWVDSLAQFAIQKFSRLKVGNADEDEGGDDSETVFAQIVQSVSEAVKGGVTGGIDSSIVRSVKKNITNKIIYMVDTVVVLKITSFLDSSILQSGYALIDHGTNANIKFDDIGKRALNLLPAIGKDILKTITLSSIENTAKNLIVDAYKGIHWDSIGLYIVTQTALEFAQTTIGKKLTKEVEKLAANALGETGGEVAGALMKNVKLDFSNLGEKLRKGQFDKIVKFDPSYIVVPTPVAKFEGWVKFTNDDPIWGDSWQATLTAKIKVGLEFIASAKYVNGSIEVKKNDSINANPDQIVKTSKYKNSFKYWFLEIGVTGLNLPIASTPIDLDGAKGKVYHHMGKSGPGVYVPADSVKFGAGLQLFLFDGSSQGNMLVFDVGAEITVLDNGFIFEMTGNASVGNTFDQKSHAIIKSVATATGYLGFNSIEKHLVGIFTATLNTSPILCAGGELDIDIEPGSWYVAVGTRAKPIYIDLFCTNHPIFKGWLAVSNQKLDMGLMVNLDIRAESPWIGFPGFKVKPWAEFKLDFGATTIVDFKPFGIEEAHVWLDLYAGIGVKYKFLFSSGDFTIASINIGGDVLFRTIPHTYFSGEMHGKVVVFNVGVGFSLNVEHEFS